MSDRLPLPAPTCPSALRPAMLGGWVLCVGLLLGSMAWAQSNDAAPAAEPASAPARTQPSVPRPSAPEALLPRSTVRWKDLAGRQQQALAPLAGQWDQLTASQRDKWLLIADQFAQLSTDEQAMLHGRMADWVMLSPKERAKARLSYVHLKAMSTEEKKSTWDEYLALSEDQRRQLQENAPRDPRTTARAQRPVPSQHLLLAPALHLHRGALSQEPTLLAPHTLLPLSPSPRAPK